MLDIQTICTRLHKYSLTNSSAVNSILQLEINLHTIDKLYSIKFLEK